MSSFPFPLYPTLSCSSNVCDFARLRLNLFKLRHWCLTKLFKSREEDELSIQASELLQVLARHDDGWVLCQNSTGAFGVVPGNYLETQGEPQKTPLATTAHTLRPATESRKDSSWQDPRTLASNGGSGSNVGGAAAVDDQQLAAQRLKEAEVGQMLLDGEGLAKLLDEKVVAITAILSSSGLAAFKGSATHDGSAMLALTAACRHHVNSARDSLKEIRELTETRRVSPARGPPKKNSPSNPAGSATGASAARLMTREMGRSRSPPPQARPATITATQSTRKAVRASASVERAKPLFAHRTFSAHDSSSSSEADEAGWEESQTGKAEGGRPVSMHEGSPEVSGQVENDGKEEDLSFVSGDVSASEEEDELGEEENGAAVPGVPALNLSKVSTPSQATRHVARNGRNGSVGGGDRIDDSPVDNASVQAASR